MAARLRAARAGSDVAREELLGAYRNYLNVLASAAIGHALRAKVDTSDVIQEALWKAHRGFPDFRGTTEGEFLAWLRKVLARTVSDQVRRYAGTGRRDLARERSIEESLDRSSTALSRMLVAEQTSPSGAAAKREEAVLLADALAALRPEHREVIVLRNLEGLDWPEVAHRMGRSPDAARMLWARALTRMRPLLGEGA